MRHLTLIRHAKSSWKTPGVADYDRPLNKRGLKNAPLMGSRLKERSITFDAIFSSGAKRALETTRLISKEIGFPFRKVVRSDRIYETDCSSLFHFASRIDDRYLDVAIVGHNPTLWELINFLSQEKIPRLPTCGTGRIRMKVEHWSHIGEEIGEIEFFDYPKNSSSVSV